MKRVFALIAMSVLIVSCKTEPKDYVTLSGKITNVNETKTLTILNREGFSKEITVNDDGTFSDTLKVTEGKYMFKHGDEYGAVYLKNDNETSFTLDTEQFDESLTFKGDDADKSNFYVANTLLQEKYLTEDLFTKSEADFDKVFADLELAYNELKEKNKAFDTAFFSPSDKEFKMMHKSYKNYHNQKIALLEAFPKGTPSPSFENYENYKGGTMSLADLKGKYVYVDVWATWCGPCKREIPFLKEVEKKFHDKNITFVSISIDKAKDHEKWKQMIEDKELGGVQLFADSDWNSQFIKDYRISGIPRFILIDPDGNIVSPDAPRPSNPELVKMFESLNM